MIIDIDYNQVKVPPEILEYCDHFVHNTEREDLRYIDCVFMNMGYYGNNLKDLEDMRKQMIPLFE